MLPRRSAVDAVPVPQFKFRSSSPEVCRPRRTAVDAVPVPKLCFNSRRSADRSSTGTGALNAVRARMANCGTWTAGLELRYLNCGTWTASTAWTANCGTWTAGLELRYLNCVNCVDGELRDLNCGTLNCGAGGGSGWECNTNSTYNLLECGPAVQRSQQWVHQHVREVRISAGIVGTLQHGECTLVCTHGHV
jgi:hypothetical protein